MLYQYIEFPMSKIRSKIHDLFFSFPGDFCEVDLSEKDCSHDLCRGSSHCAPLILGGFRCELCPTSFPDSGTSGRPVSTQSPQLCTDCSDLQHHTRYCELTTRGFTANTFLLFPALQRRHHFKIKLQ